MAKVFLTSATDPDDEHGRLELSYLQASAERDRFGVHEVTDDPKKADLVLFVEREEAAGSQLEQVREHPLVQQYREKCYVVNPRYKGIPYLTGVYASIRKKWYDRSRIRSSHYLEVQEDEIFDYKGPIPEDGYLYSFRGKLGTYPIRQHLAALSHPRGVIQDTTDENITPMMKMRCSDAELRPYKQRYAQLVDESKFILCPRGAGPSSMRLFETMLMGRVPVIISDQWVPPKGPGWGNFSIRIPESDLQDLPSTLTRMEDRAEEMGRRARLVWEEWFSPQVSFHRIVEWCLDAQNTPESFMDVLRKFRARIKPQFCCKKLSAMSSVSRSTLGGLLDGSGFA